jgi:hypothetical protein
MPTLARPRVEYRTPEDLVTDVRSGLIRIPPFQRGYKWEAVDVVKLFDSIFRGYPIGNLLLWRRRAPQQHQRIGPLEITAAAAEDALWVVDGQQRITSLAGALVAAETTADTRFRVHLDLTEGAFHTIGFRQVAPASWLPVNRLLDTQVLLDWMRQNSGWLSADQIALADQAAKAVREYQIPTYVVTSATEEPLIEIFARMNTQGKRLTKAEVFHALHSGLAENQPADLRSIGQVAAGQGFGALGERLTLRCVLAFRGGDIFREDFHDEFASEEDRIATFREVASTLGEAVDFLCDTAGIPHVRLLPYSQVLPILVRYLRLHDKPTGRAATLLRRWVWRTAVAGARSKGISVAAVRSQVRSLHEGSDPVVAAQRLLDTVDGRGGFSADLDRVHFSHAMTKINVLGMLAAEPRDPGTGRVLDIRALVEGGTPLVPLFAEEIVPDSYRLANRIIAAGKAPGGVRGALAAASAEVAMSQAMDEEARSLLRSGDSERFLRHRAALLQRLITTHVDDMAEWGARDGRSVKDMIRAAV